MALGKAENPLIHCTNTWIEEGLGGISTQVEFIYFSQYISMKSIIIIKSEIAIID